MPLLINKTGGFRLQKWYMDCVDEQERAFIGYSGGIQWRRLSTPYAASLISLPGSPPGERRSFRKAPLPVVTSSDVHWKCTDVGVDHATWSGSPTPQQRTIFENEAGRVLWTIVNANAETTIRLGDRIMRGRGYVDHVELALQTWRLPFSSLQWGRFHGDGGRSVVWLRLEASDPTTFVFLDNVECANASVERECVVLGEHGGTLDLEILHGVRSGSIAEAAFSSRWQFAVPRSLRLAQEEKWLSRGVLRLEDGTTCDGLAVHEVVKWH